MDKNKNKTRRIQDRVAATLGYVPRADLDEMAESLERELALNDSINGDWIKERQRLRNLYESLRANARRLFTLGAEAGAPRSCPTCWDQSMNSGKGGYRLSCVCSPLLPQCAYQACVRGLQITEHTIE